MSINDYKGSTVDYAGSIVDYEGSKKSLPGTVGVREGKYRLFSVILKDV